jgi:hypothetical protein
MRRQEHSRTVDLRFDSRAPSCRRTPLPYVDRDQAVNSGVDRCVSMACRLRARGPIAADHGGPRSRCASARLAIRPLDRIRRRAHVERGGVELTPGRDVVEHLSGPAWAPVNSSDQRQLRAAAELIDAFPKPLCPVDGLGSGVGDERTVTEAAAPSNARLQGIEMSVVRYGFLSPESTRDADTTTCSPTSDSLRAPTPLRHPQHCRPTAQPPRSSLPPQIR